MNKKLQKGTDPRSNLIIIIIFFDFIKKFVSANQKRSQKVF